MFAIEAVTALMSAVLDCRSTRRRGGRVAEGGGLLNLPALFVLTPLNVFCWT